MKALKLLSQTKKMHILKTQTDKLIVGTNDIAYQAPDISPTGTAVLNGPVYVGNPSPT